jgi:dipeptidyl aminopeptidase/acylaminoacyl peptidase
VATLVLALQLGSALMAPPALAFTGRNSVVAYIGPGTSAKDTTDLWLSNPDGSGARDMTPHDGRWEASPMWFVEPGRILFVSGQKGGPGDLYDMYQSGKGLENLTNTPGANEFSPSYSPGGGRITFARSLWNSGVSGPADIWEMTWTGDSPQNLTQNADSHVSNTSPVWSPDSSLLAYVRWTNDVPEIRLMSSGGLQIKNPVDLAVTPGQDPAFDSHRVNGDFQLAYSYQGALWKVIIPDPVHPTTGRLDVRPVRLTNPGNGLQDTHPRWSPDGTRIIFQRGTHTMIMLADPGSGARQVSKHTSIEPDWQAGCTKEGGDGSDVLIGTPGDDLLCDYNGNDTVYGLGGDDVIFPGAGADIVWAGPGDDYVLGGVGAYGDVIHGGPGNDLLDGGQGDDTLFGDAGNDRLQAGDGNDRVFGGAGSDSMIGGTGADVLDGNTGSDLLNNLDANGQDASDGGDGFDICWTDHGDARLGCEMPRTAP